jgi:hypothetical protein
VNDNLNTHNLSFRSREGDIMVNAAVDWTANTTLGLSAKNDININKPIKATGASAGLVMDYGGDYHLITPATFSGAVLDSTGKPVARTIPAGMEFSSVTLGGANAKLNMNGNDYTLIRSMDELAVLDDATGTATGYFALANDLDASAWSAAHTGTPSVVASLSGTLAGLGHAVDKLTLDAPLATGLVGQTTGTANVLRDIGVTNVDIIGAGGIGALVGSAPNTDISQAYATGKISATDGVVGGLAGRAGTRIDRSFASVDITISGGGTRVGGLLGIAADEITVSSSHATGNIAGTANAGDYYVIWATGEHLPMYDASGRKQEPPLDDYYIGGMYLSEVGGLLGSAIYANIDRSYATGDVYSFGGSSIGGLVGIVMGSVQPKPFDNAVTNSFATGNVLGGTAVGGLIGSIGGLLLNDANPMIVDNAYATGNVTGTKGSANGVFTGSIGGLIGHASHSNVSNAHATGNVITIADDRTANMGGLVGAQKGGSIKDSYATGTVVGNGGMNSGGLVGSSTDGSGSVSDSYYTDSKVETAAMLSPVSSELGRIVADASRRESEESHNVSTTETSSSNGALSRSTLDQSIYSNENNYSARVKSVAVEDEECAEGDDSCSKK